jgi:hypothetical protein
MTAELCTYVLSELEPLSYLSDSSGRQVTPLARTRGSPDAMPIDADEKLKRIYHRAHGNETELQKAKAIVRAHEKRQALLAAAKKDPNPRRSLVTPEFEEEVREMETMGTSHVARINYESAHSAAED